MGKFPVYIQFRTCSTLSTSIITALLEVGTYTSQRPVRFWEKQKTFIKKNYAIEFEADYSLVSVPQMLQIKVWSFVYHGHVTAKYRLLLRPKDYFCSAKPQRLCIRNYYENKLSTISRGYAVSFEAIASVLTSPLHLITKGAIKRLWHTGNSSDRQVLNKCQKISRWQTAEAASSAIPCQICKTSKRLQSFDGLTGVRLTLKKTYLGAIPQ